MMGRPRLSLVLASLLGGTMFGSKTEAEQIPSKKPAPGSSSKKASAPPTGTSDPERIMLAVKEEHIWQDNDVIKQISNSLFELSFSEAGIFSIDRIPGITLQLMLNEAERFYAVLYEHPRTGRWVNFVFRYKDGSSVTFSNTRNPNVPHDPRHELIYQPGASVEQLFEKAVAERPVRPLKQLSMENITKEFEAAWLEQRKWREKNAGAPKVSNSGAREIRPSHP